MSWKRWLPTERLKGLSVRESRNGALKVQSIDKSEGGGIELELNKLITRG